MSKKINISRSEDTEWGSNRVYIALQDFDIEILIECPIGHCVDELDPQYSVGDGWLPIPKEEKDD